MRFFADDGNMVGTGIRVLVGARTRSIWSGALVASALMFACANLTGIASAASSQGVNSSKGHSCTITGTAGNDNLKGTSGNDVICGRGGNDTITGSTGDDEIDGGPGNDTIAAGDGNDVVDGGAGADVISGGTGNDTLDGGDGKDTVKGDAGSDVIHGEHTPGTAGPNASGYTPVTLCHWGGNPAGTVGHYVEITIDTSGLSGHEGHTLDINPAPAAGCDPINTGDVLSGGDGNDVISGDRGNDQISGGAGDDTIDGDGNADTVSGDAGNDVVDGSTGPDVISGGTGDDTLDGGDGKDTVKGDAGSDIIHGEHTPGAAKPDASGYTPVTLCHWGGNPAGTVGRYVEITIDTSGLNGHEGHTLDINPAPPTGCDPTNTGDVLTGGDGNDVISGDGGNDQLSGGAGDDTIDGGDKGDTVSGGGGNDDIDGGPGNDALNGDAGNDDIDGGTGTDTIKGGTGDNGCHSGGGDEHDRFDSTCGDHQSPQLVSYDISPQTVDTSQGPATLTVTMHITDDMSGLKSGQFSLESPSLAQQIDSRSADIASMRTSGSKMDGIYTFTMTLPQYAESGHWSMSTSQNQSMFTDTAGNMWLLYYHTDDLDRTKGVDQTAPGDTEAPVVQSVSVAPSSIDTSQGPQVVTARMHITDNLSGLFEGGVTFCPNGTTFTSEQLFVWMGEWSLESGTALDGWYTGSFTVPQYATKGTYQLCGAGTRDNAHNWKGMYAIMHTLGNLSASFEQVGADDTQGPQLTALSWSTTQINTKSADALVTATVAITDAPAGLDMYMSNAQLNPPQIPGSTIRAVTSSLTRLTGTAQDGTYQITFKVPRYATCGNWTLSMVLYDKAKHDTFMTVGALTDAGFNPVITNTYS